MPTLYDWVVRRSGDFMTITHSTGKNGRIIAVSAMVIDGMPHIVARREDGVTYSLAAPNA